MDFDQFKYETEFNMNEADLKRLDVILSKINVVAPHFRDSAYDKNGEKLLLYGKSYLSLLWEYFYFLSKLLRQTKQEKIYEEIKNKLKEIERIVMDENMNNIGIIKFKDSLDEIFSDLDYYRQRAGLGLRIKKNREEKDENPYI